MHPIEDEELISRYLDGNLGGEEVRLLETHLRGCQPCWEEIALMRRLESLFSQASATLPPTGFAQRVLARLEEREARRRVLRVIPLLCIGSLLVATLVVFSLLSPIRAMAEAYMPLISMGTKLLVNGVEIGSSLCRASIMVLKTLAGVLDERLLLLYPLTVFLVMVLWARLVGPRIAYSYKGG